MSRHTPIMASVEPRGAYIAERASGLSGVPKSTVHYWARKEILVPSISAERVKLWSYADLMGLRTIYWLRQTKKAIDGRDVPRTTMPAVRRALGALRELDLSLWTEESGPAVRVDRAGHIYLAGPNTIERADGARPIDADWLDLIEPFTTHEETVGPNLQSPRPNLRIVPGKLAGSPHIVSTRIETVTVAALANRGFGRDRIHTLYPIVRAVAISEAIDLEEQLRRNLRTAA